MSVTIPLTRKPLPKVTVPMIKRAMAESLAHWRRIVRGEDHSIAEEYCPLCQLFQYGWCSSGKVKCPVFVRSELPGCGQTPWVKLAGHLYAAHRRHRRINTKTCSVCETLAEMELVYLQLAQMYNMPRRRSCRRPKMR
jgi:hypothetical protein